MKFSKNQKVTSALLRFFGGCTCSNFIDFFRSCFYFRRYTSLVRSEIFMTTTDLKKQKNNELRCIFATSQPRDMCACIFCVSVAQFLNHSVRLPLCMIFQLLGKRYNIPDGGFPLPIFNPANTALWKRFPRWKCTFWNAFFQLCATMSMYFVKVFVSISPSSVYS